jgi:hypothetical protein
MFCVDIVARGGKVNTTTLNFKRLYNSMNIMYVCLDSSTPFRRNVNTFWHMSKAGMSYYPLCVYTMKLLHLTKLYFRLKYRALTGSRMWKETCKIAYLKLFGICPIQPYKLLWITNIHFDSVYEVAPQLNKWRKGSLALHKLYFEWRQIWDTT